MKAIEKIGSTMLIVVILSYMTPLSSFAGYIIIAFGALLAILYPYKRITLRSMSFICIYILVFLAFLFINNKDLERFQIVNAFIMLFSTVLLYSMISNQYVRIQIAQSVSKINTFNGMNILGGAYWLLAIFMTAELIYFGYSNIGEWSKRIELERSTFPLGWHHVDFSVFSIGVFCVGMKSGYWKMSVALAILATLILPSRTWRLFLFLFIVSWIFKEQIHGILKIKAFNSLLKIFLWINLFTVLFSLFFVLVLPRFLMEVDGHQGLYDTSNVERFKSILYGYQLIWEKKLLLTTVNPSNAYYSKLVVSTWSSELGPHNSYVSIMLCYSVLFGLLFILCLSRIIEIFYCMRLIPYYIPYIITAIILHDMFSGVRLIIFLAVIIIPFSEPKKKLRFLCFRF